MSVYVDPQRIVELSIKWPWVHACHMMADTLDELHEMADRIGLKRAWFQDHRHPHYDLTPHKRQMAISFGAVSIGSKDMLRKILERKEGRI